MPRAAWENGAAQQQLPLERAADFILRHCESSKTAATPAALSA
jgi:chemotaxis response regulator CheB